MHYLHLHLISVSWYLHRSWQGRTLVRVVGQGRRLSVLQHRPLLHDHLTPPNKVLFVRLCVFCLLQALETSAVIVPLLVSLLLHVFCFPAVFEFLWDQVEHAAKRESVKHYSTNNLIKYNDERIYVFYFWRRASIQCSCNLLLSVQKESF